MSLSFNNPFAASRGIVHSERFKGAKPFENRASENLIDFISLIYLPLCFAE